MKRWQRVINHLNNACFLLNAFLLRWQIFIFLHNPSKVTNFNFNRSLLTLSPFYFCKDHCPYHEWILNLIQFQFLFKFSMISMIFMIFMIFMISMISMISMFSMSSMSSMSSHHYFNFSFFCLISIPRLHLQHVINLLLHHQNHSLNSFKQIIQFFFIFQMVSLLNIASFPRLLKNNKTCRLKAQSNYANSYHFHKMTVNLMIAVIKFVGPPRQINISWNFQISKITLFEILI